MIEAGETVAVVGALGTQGASVIRALQSSPVTSKWRIRALTSSPQSDSAQALSEQANMSIVYCDVNDPKTISEAFQGCTHIFANTAFHAGTLFDKGQKAGEDLENAQGLNLVRAAAEVDSLKHLVWSTLPDSCVISQGKWKVPHFMSKQDANAYILGGYTGYNEEQQRREPGWGSLRDKSTLMSIGVYGSNFRNHSYRPIRKVREPTCAFGCGPRTDAATKG
jgi:nucleoside-diphosphate-sugar epimerase